jgi:TonB family protein
MNGLGRWRFASVLAAAVSCAHAQPSEPVPTNSPGDAEPLPAGFYREPLADGGTRAWEQNPDGGPPLALGSMLKEDIRQVIHLNRDEIRHCYQSQQQPASELNGKIAVRFVIGSAGNVKRAEVAISTVNAPAFEECVLARVQTWVFPQPRGGSVIVTYPFIFQ